jgi:hypothetical protein
VDIPSSEKVVLSDSVRPIRAAIDTAIFFIRGNEGIRYDNATLPREAYHGGHAEAVTLLTEQAVCYAMVKPKETNADFIRCRVLVDYLSNGDAGTFAYFNEATAGIVPSEDGEDYPTSEYEGKADDIRAAIDDLLALESVPDATEEMRTMLIEAVDDMTYFYSAKLAEQDFAIMMGGLT